MTYARKKRASLFVLNNFLIACMILFTLSVFFFLSTGENAKRQSVQATTMAVYQGSKVPFIVVFSVRCLGQGPQSSTDGISSLRVYFGRDPSSMRSWAG